MRDRWRPAGSRNFEEMDLRSPGDGSKHDKRGVMHKSVFSAFIALLGSNVAAVAQDATPPAQASCDRPALADTAELVPVAGDNLVTVPVAINGTPRQLLLDIGSESHP